MTKLDSDRRFTIAQIKKSKWYNDAIYTDKELKAEMRKIKFLEDIDPNESQSSYYV